MSKYLIDADGHFICEVHTDNGIPKNSVLISAEPPSEGLHRWNGEAWVSEPHVDALISYKDLRRVEYPPFADFADAWVKGDQAALDDYRKKCLAVKQAFPKI